MNKSSAKKTATELVSKYERIRHRLIKPSRFFSEQDITTKFVLPLLGALGWDTYGAAKGRVEVKEKGFKGKKAKHGLPDITLTDSRGKKIYVEVKKPWVRLNPKAQLRRYKRDSDVLLLTSFERSVICAYGHGQIHKPKDCEIKYTQYVARFNDLWNRLSNTQKGRDTRAGIKAQASRS